MSPETRPLPEDDPELQAILGGLVDLYATGHHGDLSLLLAGTPQRRLAALMEVAVSVAWIASTEYGLDRKCPRCPLCGSLPQQTLLGLRTQRFCPDDDCKMFCWDPTVAAGEQLSTAVVVDLP
jgi:hypothetical protein